MRALNKEPLDIEARLLAGWHPRAFVALDFETANRSRSSACAVALVRVEGDRIVEWAAGLQHDTISDAMACANIVLASMGRVQRQGLEP
jgi:DNA polymerase III epsilon subunit-like protein